MLIAFFIVIFNIVDVFSFKCNEGLAGSCHCVADKRATYQLHCPSFQPDKKLFTVLIKDKEFALVSCVRGATANDIYNLLEQVQLGQIKTLKLKGCPYPKHSYQRSLEEMGIVGVQHLQIHGIRGQFGSFGNSRLRNLPALKVDLRHVSDVDIDGDFFKNSSSIKQVLLNDIRGLKLSKMAFRNLPNLTYLGLSSSRIESLEKEIFQDLSTLTYLNLHGNNLAKLPSGIFDNLSNLTTLNLGKNFLKTLPEDIFSKNYQLEEAILSYNCFESFPENLLAGKQKLKTFDFRRNVKRINAGRCQGKYAVLELPKTTFQNSSIKEIKLLNVEITSLPADLLKGCHLITEIIIQSSSNIKTIPPTFFKDNPLLEKVDFVNNGIGELDVNTFKGLSKLKILRLNWNNISSVDPELFADLSNLEILHISHNNIKDINDKIFEKAQIKEVDLSYNNLNSSFTKYFDIRLNTTFRTIQKLDLSMNNISGDIDVRKADIGDRNITIDLTKNNVQRILFSNDRLKNGKEKFILILKKNPLSCDCFATEIKQQLESKRNEEAGTRVFVDNEDFVCPENKNLLDTSYADLTCPVPSQLIDEKCPEKCKCHLNRYSRRVSVNCTGQALTQIPEKLPKIPGESDGIILHMENNFLTNLTDSLQRLANNNYSNFDSIYELHLSRNRLKYMGDHFPSNLEYLSLDGNNIQGYKKTTLQYFQNKLKQSNLSLRLGSNPYECNCNSLDLLHFLKMFYSHVADRDDLTVKCLEKRLFIQNEEELCQSFPVFTYLIPAIFFILVVITFLILHIHKETLMIYIFSKSWGKIFFSEEKIDINKPYDAFLSYSHHDEDFVEKVLLPGLESEENLKEEQYKCLIHTRDWKVGDMISDQIIESVDSCRRTIIVLSVGYIKSTWSKLEFQAAHAKAMKEKTQRVIIILHGEKPDKDHLDEDLKKYLVSNTFIDTQDPWFWKKLRYALPKKSYKQKKSKKFRDKSTDQADDKEAKRKRIHHDTTEDSSNQDKVQLPYYKKQFSREKLLPSESLKRDLGGIQHIC